MSQYMTNFTGEDMKIAYAKGSEPEEEPQAEAAAETEAEPEAEAGDEEVPEGTTAEILAWVGDDQDRAQRALDAENADEKPRKGLTGELEALLGEDEEE